MPRILTKPCALMKEVSIYATILQRNQLCLPAQRQGGSLRALRRLSLISYRRGVFVKKSSLSAGRGSSPISASG